MPFGNIPTLEKSVTAAFHQIVIVMQELATSLTPAWKIFASAASACPFRSAWTLNVCPSAAVLSSQHGLASMNVVVCTLPGETNTLVGCAQNKKCSCSPNMSRKEGPANKWLWKLWSVSSGTCAYVTRECRQERSCHKVSLSCLIWQKDNQWAGQGMFTDRICIIYLAAGK